MVSRNLALRTNAALMQGQLPQESLQVPADARQLHFQATVREIGEQRVLLGGLAWRQLPSAVARALQLAGALPVLHTS